MKRLLLSAALAMVAHWLTAQITITADAYFPKVGDTLRYAIDVAPAGISITAPGGPFEWDFSGLNLEFETETVYRPASEGNAAADFPTADLFTGNATAGETYYKVTPNAFQVLGFKGPSPVAINLFTLFKFTTPVPERHAPLTFPANFTSSSSVNVPFATSDLPGGLLDSLGLPFLPDSLRVRVTTQRNDFVDAHGKLSIPGDTYDVLREKRTEFRDTRVDAKLPFLGWQDVTDLILAGGNFGGLGKDTVVSYHFFSDAAIEAIAVVTMENVTGDEVQQVRFKNNGPFTSVSDVNVHGPVVVVSPNPVAGLAKFDLKNAVPGDYSLQVFNVHGVLVCSKKFRADGNAVQYLDLSDVPGGTYFYRLLNQQQAVVSSGKLSKI